MGRWVDNWMFAGVGVPVKSPPLAPSLREDRGSRIEDRGKNPPPAPSLRRRVFDPRGRGVGAFSLAELMIALAILGMGLLVIGAALPVGVRYTKDSVDMDTGAAATDYALSLIEQGVCLRDQILDPNRPGQMNNLLRAPSIFVPRYQLNDTRGPEGEPARDLTNPNLPYEPRIKVRPLYTQNIYAKPSSSVFSEELDVAMGCRTELVIATWYGGGIASVLEADCDPTSPPWLRPAISSLSAVYPPVSAVAMTAGEHYPDYFLSSAARMYEQRAVDPAELSKTRDRRMTWAAFYRRLSYAPNSDPSLYEFVVVACRLPSLRHRFPLQRISRGGGAFAAATAAPPGKQYDKEDVLAPVPWLVTFQMVPWLRPGVDFDNSQPTRPLLSSFVPPSTLTFEANEAVGVLLPKGSIFIPAVNDNLPSDIAASVSPMPFLQGFVPHSPEALPIYEVKDRVWNTAKGHYEIIVENNGLYPWAQDGTAGSPNYQRRWPVWVIPPAFEELDAAGDPVYSDKSPIVAIQRRCVVLTEVP